MCFIAPRCFHDSVRNFVLICLFGDALCSSRPTPVCTRTFHAQNSTQKQSDAQKPSCFKKRISARVGKRWPFETEDPIFLCFCRPFFKKGLKEPTVDPDRDYILILPFFQKAKSFLKVPLSMSGIQNFTLMHQRCLFPLGLRYLELHSHFCISLCINN